MAGHPQTTPRGLWAGDMLLGSGGLTFPDYSTSAALLDANTTGLKVAGKVQLNNQKYIGSNSTAFVLDTVSALPSTRVVGGLVIVSNSTSKALAFHQTGTTWQYANVTSVQPS